MGVKSLGQHVAEAEIAAARREEIERPLRAEITRLRAENERLQGIIENMREIRTTREALGK